MTITSDEFRVRISASRCVYCGNPAQSDDHWPPRSLTPHGYILPACIECNELASDDEPRDFRKRAELVISRLKRKYSKILNSPDWTLEEIEALGGNLRKEIEDWRNVKLNLNRRVAWNAIAYIASIDHSRCFVLSDVEWLLIDAEKRSLLTTSLDNAIEGSNSKTEKLEFEIVELKSWNDCLRKLNQENREKAIKAAAKVGRLRVIEAVMRAVG